MIRVLVNGRFLGQRVTGAQRYAREVLAAMDRLAAEASFRDRFAVTILVPRGTPVPALAGTAVRAVGRLTGHLWEQIELPRYARGGVLLSLCNTAPLTGHNMVATIHDASVYAFPRAYSRAFLGWYRVMIPIVGYRARRMIMSSQFSRRELRHYARIDPAKVSVIPGSGEHIVAQPADEGVLDRLALRAGPYVLAVSSRSPHKNVGRVAEAAALLGDRAFDVVLAGGSNPRVFHRGGAAPSTGRIRVAGYVSDAELRALYEHAACFLYPSLYEGFGLPPLEAMTCGCPVIASRAASLPEVCGDAALYCDPKDPADIARAIGTVLDDAALREDLRRRGREQAARFRWSDAAHAVFGLLAGLTAR